MDHAKARWRPALARIMMKSTRPGPSSKAGKGRVQIGAPSRTARSRFTTSMTWLVGVSCGFYALHKSCVRAEPIFVIGRGHYTLFDHHDGASRQ